MSARISSLVGSFVFMNAICCCLSAVIKNISQYTYTHNTIACLCERGQVLFYHKFSQQKPIFDYERNVSFHFAGEKKEMFLCV